MSPLNEVATIKISQPAHRALKSAGIETLEQLTQYKEGELLALHGFGTKALVILKNILEECGLSFKKILDNFKRYTEGTNL